MLPYRILIALQQEVDRQINELLHLKLIEPSENAYPMQNAKDLLFEVGQANYITVQDLTKGYWQIPMAEEAKPYTAFVIHHGHYQFCVMPFGMKNAGNTFQKVMDRVLLVKAPSLYTPNLSKPYQLYTDASATATGACLSQNDEKGKENPIAFFSKKLIEAQTRWETIEREVYAVIEVLKRLDSWIFGAEIQVISDHNPLTYLTLTTPQSAKLTRWA
ncbi:retrovirus-related Pol polyprotein from transposon opus [Trichonephila clavipes]|nr:retrovirus-related Pol polyprotein from transposon opus [Trichonephila clavipes]